MKKTLISTVCALALSFQSASATEVIDNITKNVLQANANNVVKEAKELDVSLETKSLVKAQAAFEEFILAWKRVQAVYIAPEVNEDVTDTPRYLDIFHHGNEDITKQLARIIKSNDALEEVLYKHSNKSVNALEYVLFTKDFDSKYDARRLEVARFIVASITEYLKQIQAVYNNERTLKLLKDEQWANDVLVNALIESSYKLKEWRVGDAAGLSKKYKNKPDNARAEYALSGYSTEAIEAILLTHKAIMNKEGAEDFGDYAARSGAKEAVSKIQKALDAALVDVKKNSK